MEVPTTTTRAITDATATIMNVTITHLAIHHFIRSVFVEFSAALSEPNLRFLTLSSVTFRDSSLTGDSSLACDSSLASDSSLAGVIAFK